MRGVAGVERTGSDIDKETGGGRAQVAALVAGERLADIPHGMTASAGVELDPGEVHECLGDDRVIPCTPSQLGGLLEQGDGGHRLAGPRGVTAPFAGNCSLEDDVAAALGKPERRLPVGRPRQGSSRRRAPPRDRTSHSTPNRRGQATRRSAHRERPPQRESVAEQLVRETARQQRGTALLGLTVIRKPLECAVIRGDRIGQAAVPKGGRAGCEFIRAIRVQSGVRLKRHG